MNEELKVKIDKVKKVLALANAAGTPAEAEAAFARASELMAKYGIEQAHIQASQSAEESKRSIQMDKCSTRDKATVTERPFHGPICCILNHCFNVEVVLNRTRALVNGKFSTLHFHTILGEASDVAFARYAFDLLETTFLRLLGDYYKSNGIKERSSKHYVPFFLGLSQGFINAWDEAKAAELSKHSAADVQSFALVIQDKDALLAAYLKEQFPTLKMPRAHTIRNIAAFQAGVKAGKDIKVNRAIS